MALRLHRAKRSAMSPAKLRLAFSLAVCFLGFGCLSNSYVVQHDELTRLAALEPDDRWASVRAVQRIGGDDYPPENDTFPPTPEEHVHGVYVGTVVVRSNHH